MSLSGWLYDNPFGYFEQQQPQASANQTYADDNSSEIRVFKLSWVLVPQFLDDLLGYSRINGTGIARVLPDQHPNKPALYAMEASVQGYGTCSQAAGLNYINYDQAIVTATYKPVDFAVLADNQIETELDRYCTRTYTFATEFITLQGFLRFVTDSTHRPMATSPGKTTGTVEKTILWRSVPSNPASPFECPNATTFATLAGYINSTDFDGHPRGTVLFLGAAPRMIKPKLSPIGVPTLFSWDIELKFLVRQNTSGNVAGFMEVANHNFVWDVVNNRWDMVTSDGTTGGSTLYQYEDLNQMFLL